MGVTNNLERRIYEHKSKEIDGFTKRYNIDRLLYYEEIDTITSAIKREKQIKKYSRQRKLNLIESTNIGYKDLAEDLFDRHFSCY